MSYLKGTNLTAGACPYLGCCSARETYYSYPSRGNCCHAGAEPFRIERSFQAANCLAKEWPACPRYKAAQEGVEFHDTTGVARREQTRVRRLPVWAIVGIVAGAGLLLAVLLWLLLPKGSTSDTFTLTAGSLSLTPGVTATAIAAQSATPTATYTATPSPSPTATPSPPPTATPSPSPTATPIHSGGLTGAESGTVTASPTTTVLVGAGDIAGCGSEKDEETARLLDNIAGTVFTLGDNVYPDGTAELFTDCYDPTWGRHKARTHPSPGNHDYLVPGAPGYFDYFGAAAGEVGKGYYSYDVGDWHIIVLNSECVEAGGCGSDSPQGQWLKADLAANPSTCTLAYWHTPRFSSGSVHGNDAHMQDFWQLLYDAGADVVLNGHEHLYERFAPQDPNGVADPEHGIRQFTVGTGGKSLYAFGTVQPNSEVRNSDTYGVLKLTLYPTSYDWEFIPIAGQTFTDSGSANCVSAP
jgi:hypothetical protein